MITAQSQNIPSDTSEDVWTRLKENIKESSDETIGFMERQAPGKSWVIQATLVKMGKRRQ